MVQPALDQLHVLPWVVLRAAAEILAAILNVVARRDLARHQRQVVLSAAAARLDVVAVAVEALDSAVLTS